MSDIIIPVLLSMMMGMAMIQIDSTKRMLFQAYIAPTVVFYMINSIIPVSYFISAFIVDFITIYILLLLPKRGIYRLLLITICFTSMIANFYGLINFDTENDATAKIVYESGFLAIYGVALLIMLTGTYRDRVINYIWTGLFSDRRNINYQIRIQK